jgi:ribosome-binding protein aMBF1 (putative translation factor)
MKSSYNNNTQYKTYQDFEPVVLYKSKNKSSLTNSNSKSNSHIHIHNNNNIDTDDIVSIPKYTFEQINIIKNARIALKLSQTELTKKISPTLPSNFISNIESGNATFHQRNYNTILRVLNIKNT